MEYKDLQSLEICKDNLKLQVTELELIIEQGRLDFLDSQLKKYGVHKQSEDGTESWMIKLHKKNQFHRYYQIVEVGYDGKGYISFKDVEGVEWQEFYRDLDVNSLKQIVDAVYKEFKNK